MWKDIIHFLCSSLCVDCHRRLSTHYLYSLVAVRSVRVARAHSEGALHESTACQNLLRHLDHFQTPLMVCGSRIFLHHLLTPPSRLLKLSLISRMAVGSLQHEEQEFVLYVGEGRSAQKTQVHHPSSLSVLLSCSGSG